MSTPEFDTLSDAELKDVPAEEFVSALRDLPREALEKLSKRPTLTDAQSGALSAFLSMSPLMQSDSRDPIEDHGGDDLDAHAPDDKYVPLKNRLTAWWNGTSQSGNYDGASGADYGLESDGLDLDANSDPNSIWSDSAIEIAEAVWGEGFIEPGGAALARKVIAPASPDSTKTVLDLTAGMAGTACTFAREANLWMEAYESDPALARRAREITRTYMLSKRVPIEQVDYATVDLKLKRYDLIYSRDRLYTTPHKRRLMQQVAGALKPGGQFLVTDYVRRKESGFTEPFDKWIDAEPQVIYPWTDAQYVEEMRKAGLKLRTSHDFSEKVLSQIHAGWLRMMRSLDTDDVDRSFVSRLVHEGEIWLARAKALESGDVQVIRIVAVAS